ncbi:MAG: HlyD family efflux transporter periplasmic adaptor subunit [Magnetococcales bacterium]|nr:HlyD family efflux transporter periplasmic adaptor subunit [Magnetococcales bacterium]
MGRIGISIILGLLALLTDRPLFAHGGEDHGSPTIALEALPSGLGVGGSGERFEAVIVADHESTRLYLASLADNAPVPQATIEVEAGGATAWRGQGTATSTAGVYQLDWQPPGHQEADLTLTITAQGEEDLILIRLPARTADTPSHAPVAPTPGVVALPKASQFLLELRTTLAAPAEVAETVRLVGRVIPDPAVHARIHPPFTARIGHDPDFPPPRSGQWVKRGQTLAVLDPVLTASEKAGQRLALFKGDRPESTVGREMVLAPINGRLSDVHITPGEVVTEATLLAEIIDPNRLWIEAILYDLMLAERIVGGVASSRQIPNRQFPLQLTGISSRVNPENLGLHVQFALDFSGHGPSGIKSGMPMDVFAHTGLTRLELAIPRAALTDRSGLPTVWVQSGPEQFAARSVRIGRRLADRVEILEGLRPEERVVVRGTQMLQAIR